MIAEGLNISPLNSSTEAVDAINAVENIGTVLIQRGFFFVFMGLIIGTMISAFFIDSHPIFLFLYIIFLAVSIMLSVYLGNAYENLTELTIFANISATQTLINFVMNNIVVIMVAVGSLSIIIVFSKFSSGGGGGGRL